MLDLDQIKYRVILLCHIIIGGDWNVDLARNDGRSKLFKEFIVQENLYNPLNLDISCVPYTYYVEKKDKGIITYTHSVIDHFLISPNLIKTVECYEARTLPNNVSDHIPLKLNLKIDHEFHETQKRVFQPSVKWHNCDATSKKNYKQTLDQDLLNVNPCHEALRCNNCKYTKHNELIHELYSKIINYTGNASNICLPHTKDKKARKVIPGWNEYVKEPADESRKWHALWVLNGRPREGYLAYMRRKTRAYYRYAIRYAVNNEILIRNNRLAEAMSDNNDRVLWDEVRKMTKANKDLPNMMDGVTNENDITDIFASNYKTLYNSVSYNKHDLHRLSTEIDSRIDENYPNYTDNSYNRTITVQEVKNAVLELKQGKKEENGLYSNHFINGPDRLIVLITLLFNCMFIHGVAPDDLLLGTMIPLIKNSRGNKQSSDNYRSLTIGTGLAKLLDIVILNQQSEKLKTCDQQFGFKEKSSTTMCTFMALETIEHYKSNGGNVHTLLLDASKAFDRVDYIKLFDKLLARGMCPLTVRLLLSMYTKQKLQVKWNSCISPKFEVTNGVRQGGVLSPLLFTVYVDDLLIKLRRNGIGCHLGPHFVGALGYADDIMLLCPTVEGLRMMIKICEEYANEHSIMFNGSKSKYLVFGNYKYNPTIQVNNETVSRCTSAMHLGHMLHTENTKKELIDQAVTEFKKGYYGFISKFESCYNSTKNKLFHQYCSSMYGSQLWDKTSATIQTIYTQWRKAHRQVLSVPYNTHCDLLPLIADNMPLEYILDCRYVSYYQSIVNSENKIVSYTARNKIFDCSSTLGRNITHLVHKYNITIDDIKSLSKNTIKELSKSTWLSGINKEYPRYAQIIKDMIGMKELSGTRAYVYPPYSEIVNGMIGMNDVNGTNSFTKEECQTIIDYCCVI